MNKHLRTGYKIEKTQQYTTKREEGESTTSHKSSQVVA